MAINTALLIAAPMLQDALVNKDTGIAMSAGTVTLYQDNSRTTLKNWYYQSGTPGAYTYITLPNPLTLSAAGTIADPQGNDTIPFFYPYSEDDNITAQPYYIVVKNSNGEDQFTRANFPFIPNEPLNPDTPTLQNILINNVFWRNIGSLNVSSSLNAVVAPGAHDGYTDPDIRFVKSKTGATDTVTFSSFSLGDDAFSPEVTPEYYLNFNCSALTGGETNKAIQIPISLHINTLESMPATVVLWARNVPGSTSNNLTLSILQFLGTGALSQPAPTLFKTIPLTNSWQKYAINFTFPSALGAAVGGGGDDALYLQIGFPLSATCNIDIAKPAIYLSNEVPTNEFTDYDQVNAVISAPRTGDIRTTLNNFGPFGWVGLTDASIGSPASGATYPNINTWQLYSLLWNSVGVTYAPMVDASPYGASAIADWNANRGIYLTKQLGRLIGSIGTPSSGNNTGTSWALGQTTGGERTNHVAAHTHTGTVTVTGSSTAGGDHSTLYFQTQNNNVSANFNFTTNSTGDAEVNIQNPVVYYHVFMKL